MSSVTEISRRAAELDVLFPVRTFRFIVCNTLSPGQSHDVRLRGHPVLFYVLSGCIEMRMDGETVLMNTGDFYFLDQGSGQHYRNASSENTYLYITGFHFADPVTRMRDLEIPVHGSFSDTPIVAGLFGKLHQCWMEHKPGCGMQLFSLFFNILHYISVHQAETTEFPPEYHRLQDLVHYIHDNCFRPELCVEDLCRQCNYSPAYLRKLFVKYLQLPPTQYIRHIRLELAKNMLVLSHKSITQIAMEVGYKDVAHFDRVFKKDTGLTPQKYRSLNFINNVTEN